jgi:hypothetical protein
MKRNKNNNTGTQHICRAERASRIKKLTLCLGDKRLCTNAHYTFPLEIGLTVMNFINKECY